MEAEWIAIAGLFVTLVIFLANGAELRREAQRLRKQINIVLRALEKAGLATISRDDKGEPLGIVHFLEFKGVSRSVGSISFTVVPPEHEESSEDLS